MRKPNNNLVERIQEAIRGERLDGWLFCNFRHRDPLADHILGIPKQCTNSRYWLYAVPARGTPLALAHTIEQDHLDGLPAERYTYTDRDELRARLALLAGKRWAVHVSDTIPAVSYMDAGMYRFLTDASLQLVSAEGLIGRVMGTLDTAGAASHERAAACLYDIVGTTWEYVRASYTERRPLYEGDIRQHIEEAFLRRGLTRDHPPLVAAGVHSANPHYDFEGRGARIHEGDIIQLDLWAKEQTNGSIYADISWVGVYSAKAPPRAEAAFTALVEAREQTLAFLDEAFGIYADGIHADTASPALSGADVDRYCRSLLQAKGYGAALRHRTGHGIDTQAHGVGVNLDSVEFPDTRALIEGACFSVEPGLYFTGYGFRTEVNVYIKAMCPVVSGVGGAYTRQFSLLCC